jgi:hypothetical protein
MVSVRSRPRRAADCQANRREDSSCRQRVRRLIKASTLSHPEDPHPPQRGWAGRPAFKAIRQKDEGVALDERSFIAFAGKQRPWM